MATITIKSEAVFLCGGLCLGAGIAALAAYWSQEEQKKKIEASIQELYAERFPRAMRPSEGSVASSDHEKWMGTAGDKTPVKNIPTRVSSVVPSMEDIIVSQQEAALEMARLTPEMVLSRLQQGNARFWMGVAERPEMSAMERRAMIMQQFPKAAVLGCSDSRVPIEIVFDQGLGDIFAIRVAGNSYGTGVAASIDYAVAHLKVKVVVVLGHEGCGAVRAALQPLSAVQQESESLANFLTSMKKGLSQHPGLPSIRDARARDREAVITNVRAQIATISKTPLIKEKVDAGELLVVGAFYEISSGMVDFIDVSGDVAVRTGNRILNRRSYTPACPQPHPTRPSRAHGVRHPLCAGPRLVPSRHPGLVAPRDSRCDHPLRPSLIGLDQQHV